MNSNRVLHILLISIGAALVAAGQASGIQVLSVIGTAVTALAGASGTLFAPAVGQGDK